jgi:hypothetical protein
MRMTNQSITLHTSRAVDRVAVIDADWRNAVAVPDVLILTLASKLASMLTS